MELANDSEEFKIPLSKPKTNFCADITPFVPNGIPCRGVAVHIEVHKPGGNIRPKQTIGRAEKSVKLMEKKSGPQGGYSTKNIKEVKKKSKYCVEILG